MSKYHSPQFPNLTRFPVSTAVVDKGKSPISYGMVEEVAQK